MAFNGRYLAQIAGILLLVALEMAAISSPAQALNAVQTRENRANHDRWARSSASGTSSAAEDDDEDDSDSDKSKSVKTAALKPSIHDGELNGNLHLKGW